MGNQASLQLGAACEDAAQCQSDVCAQAVCCDRPCSGVESCALPGTRGVCTARTLGKECSDSSQCLEGTCVDRVCCATACEGDCVTCNGEQPGTCTAVPDNQDPRDRCEMPCGACVGGVCLPTAPGTDPHGVCPAGTACGALGACLTQGGGTCVQDADCAVGRCVAGLCLRLTSEDLLSLRLADMSATTRLVGFDVDESGNAHALVHQRWRIPNTSTETTRLYLLHRNGGAWNGPVVVTHYACSLGVRQEGAITHVGRQTFVAFLDAPAAVGQRCGSFPPDLLPPGQVVLRWLEEDGALRLEVPAPNPEEGGLESASWVRAVHDGDNNIFVAFSAIVAGRGGVFLSQFVLDDGAFTGPAIRLGDVDGPNPGDLVLVNNQPVVVTTGSEVDELLALWTNESAPGQGQQASHFLPGCLIMRVGASTAPDQAVHWAADCSSAGDVRGAAPRVGTLLLGTDGPAMFQETALAATARSMSTAPILLADDAMGYVVARPYQPLAILLGNPPGTLTHPMGEALGGFENVFNVVRGRTGRLAYAAWTLDVTDGPLFSDNDTILSSRIFWVSLAP